MFKKLNIRGVSHHFLLPVLAVLVVAGIGGYIMQRSSSAATKCSRRTFSVGSKSECVRDIQTIVGAHADAAYGPDTAKKVKTVLGGTGNTVAPGSGGWNKLCNRALKKSGGSTTNQYYWSYEHACLGKNKYTPSTKISVKKVTNVRKFYPAKPYLITKTVYVATKAEKTNIQNSSARNTEQYNRDLKAYKVSKLYKSQSGSSSISNAYATFKADCAKTPGKISGEICKANKI